MCERWGPTQNSLGASLRPLCQMLKYLTAAVLLLGTCPWARGQQLPMFSQLQDNAEVLNPAALSANFLRFEHNVQIAGVYREQWAQFEGHPRTMALSASYLVGEYEGVTPHIGVSFLSDRTGPTGFTGAYAKFAGLISGDPYEGGVSIGLQAGFNQYRVAFDELVLREEESVFLTDDDTRLYPDVGVGVFAYKRFRENVYYAGVSSPQLLSLEVGFGPRDSAVVTQRYRHYYAQLGGIFNIDRNSYWEPVVWIRQVPGAPLHASASVRYQTELSVFVGAGASTTEALHGEVGVLLGEADDRLIRLGYGFDYSFQSYGQYAGATHEFQFSYSLYR